MLINFPNKGLKAKYFTTFQIIEKMKFNELFLFTFNKFKNRFSFYNIIITYFNFNNDKNE